VRKAVVLGLGLLLALLGLVVIAQFLGPGLTTGGLSEYYKTGDDSGVSVYGIYWSAQTFTVGTTAHTVTSVKLKLYRVGSPGTVTVSIRATSAGHPIGSDLTSGTIDGTSLNATEPGSWYRITLTEYSLSASAKYAVVIRAPSGNYTIPNPPEKPYANKLVWMADNTSPAYTGGNCEGSADSGSTWSSYADADLMFEVWGR